MMKFSIQVNEGPYKHQASDTAFSLPRLRWTQVMKSFVYSSITMVLTTRHDTSVPPQDDRNIPKLWSELAKEHNLDLVVCIAAAQRRGMMDEDEAKRQGFEDNNID